MTIFTSKWEEKRAQQSERRKYVGQWMPIGHIISVFYFLYQLGKTFISSQNLINVLAYRFTGEQVKNREDV